LKYSLQRDFANPFSGGPVFDTARLLMPMEYEKILEINNYSSYEEIIVAIGFEGHTGGRGQRCLRLLILQISTGAVNRL